MKVDNNNAEFYLVNDLRSIAKEFWKKKEYENLSLQIQKLIPFGWDDIKKKDKQKPKPRYSAFGYDIQLPDKALAEYKIFYKLQELLWKSKLQEYRINPDKFLKDLKLETKSRLIIGLGDESVYETSIRLHRNYGVPYVPGSALKGVAKHYSIYKMVESNYSKLKEKLKKDDFLELAGEVQKLLENQNDEDVKDYNLEFKLNSEKVNLNDLRKIFGTQSFEGLVIFFDAFPTYECLKELTKNNKPILELDIMNPHYQPYYSARENELKSVENAPGDWHDPNPIFFLTVPAGIEFQFALALRDGDKDLLKKAKNLLIEVLKNHGIGAKTSLGYGRFQ